MPKAKDYIFTVQFAFSAPDDIGARMIGRGIKAAVSNAMAMSKAVTMKLQEKFPDKPPRKVTL